ncbi:tyrosine-type recombinase/integrase [Mycobacterium colombiense]
MAATIRKRTTGKLDKFGNSVVSYQVRWREPVRDEFGAPTGKFKQTSETFDTERKAKAHMRKVENQLEDARGVDPSSQKAKANTPVGTYARQYLDSLVGSVDDSTIEGYSKIYRTHIAPAFGQAPVAAITTADVARFRASLLAPHQRQHGRAKATPSSRPGLVTRSPKTVKHIVGTLKRILDVAVDDQAIVANPVVAGRRHTTKRHTAVGGKAPFKHRPLTANQVASVVDWISRNGSQGRGNDVYALAVLFAAHTGVRASELQGLQLQDVTSSTIHATVGSIRVVRTAKRKGREWIYGTPKSEASSDRVVPLAPWLADELREYLTETHPFSATNRQGMKYIPHAPLFPGRRNRYTFDWAKPVHAGSLHEHYFAQACRECGLGPVRFHDLRHTFATMNLSAGEHYMQVSKWLGHSSFVLTLSTYADYINEDELVAPKVERGTADIITANVVALPTRNAQ